MECNKEEAVKAKAIAELKVTKLDYAGAKRFALKAQNLYPGLDGLPQLFATLDIYTAAQKVNGEVNWYKVLGVEPLADEETIQKQYRKLALVLHPDKNKSVGAEGAFKLLSEARRILYEKKSNLNYMHARVPDGMPTGRSGFHSFSENNNSTTRDYRNTTQMGFSDGKSSIPTSHNGLRSFSNSNKLYTKDRKSATRTKPSTSRPPKNPKSTFWTVCSNCKMYFEYLNTFLNHRLLCHNCSTPFLARETPAPRNAGSSTKWLSDIEQQTSSQHSTDVKLSRLSGVSGSEQAPASSSDQVAGGTQPAFRGLKRGHEEASPNKEAHEWKFHDFKKPDTVLPTGSGNIDFSSACNGVKPKKKRHRYRQEMPTQVGRENGGVSMSRVYGSHKAVFGTGRLDVAAKHRVNFTRELLPHELRKMLVEKAKKEIGSKIGKNIASVSKTVDTKEIKKREQEEAGVVGVKTDMKGCRAFVDAKGVEEKNSIPASSHGDCGVDEANASSMDVPDPDFHDFDNDRTEKSFGSNQVWAVYDEDDGMPRYYAMVHNVISLKPFKIRISWLNSKSNSELAPLNWVACGFPKTCGDLRIGKQNIYRYLNTFSHKVKWTKGKRGAVCIYPTKGDVWALYSNWSPDWSELTEDEVIHKYDMVEVLEDYNEERGVRIVPLVKVPGFKTVFRQHLDRSKFKTIPREEMFRFSHQVPYYLLTGDEGPNAPQGCLDLDPASTPLELLQVESRAQDEMEEKAEESGLVKHAEGKDLEDLMKEPQEKKMLVYRRKRLREGQMVEGDK